MFETMTFVQNVSMRLTVHKFKYTGNVLFSCGKKCPSLDLNTELETDLRSSKRLDPEL
jgi:hypothetical protein